MFRFAPAPLDLLVLASGPELDLANRLAHPRKGPHRPEFPGTAGGRRFKGHGSRGRKRCRICLTLLAGTHRFQQSSLCYWGLKSAIASFPVCYKETESRSPYWLPLSPAPQPDHPSPSLYPQLQHHTGGKGRAYHGQSISFYLQFRSLPAGRAAACALCLMRSKATKELLMITNMSDYEEAPVPTRHDTLRPAFVLAAIWRFQHSALLAAGLAVLVSAAGAAGQGTFHNLDFESAVLVPVAGDPRGGVRFDLHSQDGRRMLVGLRLTQLGIRTLCITTSSWIPPELALLTVTMLMDQ